MGTFEAVSFMLILIFAAVLIAAAIGDWRRYIISNRTVIAVLVLFVLFIVLQIILPTETRIIKDPVKYLLITSTLATAVFAITTVLFVVGLMGGGDVKLMTVIVFWAGPDFIVPFLILTTLAGGIVTLGVVIRHKFFMAQHAHLLASGSEASQIVNPLSSSMAAVKVPYGLAICVGGLGVVYTLIIKTPGLF